jgi:hypothetical protein
MKGISLFACLQFTKNYLLILSNIVDFVSLVTAHDGREQGSGSQELSHVGP